MDKMEKMDNQELISALADGQLQGEDLARALQAAADARAREAWHVYHVVGEVLRTGQPAVGSPPQAFLARLQQSLKEEAPVAAAAMPAVRAVASPDRLAANDWLWKLAAGVASVAAVAAVGWNLWGGAAAPTAQPQLAEAPAAAPEAPEAGAGAMVRDAQLDQFLAAHRQLGGATALQTSAGFLRNATFQAAGR